MKLPQPVRYYHTPRAPNPRRVQIFMAEKGIELETVHVNLMEGEHKQPEYLDKVGSPQIPAIGGRVLEEDVVDEVVAGAG